MYDYLTGKITHLGAGKMVLDHQGIGYSIEIPISLTDQLELNQELRFYVHYHVSENDHQLYGFLDRFSREVFLLLISVSGVGPKMGMRILGHKNSRELMEAVAMKDLQAIVGVKGLGEKTSQRLVVEIQKKAEKLILFHSDDPQDKMPKSLGDDPLGGQAIKIREDLKLALINLGYKESEIRALLEQMVDLERQQVQKGAVERLDFEVILKKILQKISLVP